MMRNSALIHIVSPLIVIVDVSDELVGPNVNVNVITLTELK